MKLEIDRERLTQEIDALGAISQEPPPVVTRVVFTEADMRARQFVKKLCCDAGLTVREDAVGNTFARWDGKNPDLEPIGTGSHIDAIPNAGRFDGTVRRAWRIGSDASARTSWLPAASFYRACHLYLRGTNSLWYRMPRKQAYGWPARSTGSQRFERSPRHVARSGSIGSGLSGTVVLSLLARGILRGIH